MRPATVLLLNGTSSSGKSSIAKSLQAIMDAPFLHTGIDHFLERWPERYHVWSNNPHLPLPEGFHWLTSPDERELHELRIGPVGMQLEIGMYHAVAAFAAAGNHVIVDDVIFDPRTLTVAARVLAPSFAFFIGVRCALEVAEQRERARGDRFPGLVKAHYQQVHRHGCYDLEVDTAQQTPEECARRIKQFLDEGAQPTALRRLQQQLRDR